MFSVVSSLKNCAYKSLTSSNFFCPKEFRKLPNKFTQEQLELEGIALASALSNLADDIASCDTIVAHNLQFDFNVIAAECYRILANGNNDIARKLVDKMTSMKKVCTMELGMQKLGRTRRIKLSHLYEELTDEEWDQQHRAEDDARVCGICYWLLVDML